MQNSFSVKAIGVMSGSSLDGLDLSYCEYIYTSGKWMYYWIDGKTVPFSDDLYQNLVKVSTLNALEVFHADVSLGKWIGQQIQSWCKENSYQPDIIGSHGHTVFHQPGLGFSTQIGSGAAIAYWSGIKTVCDFRQGDVVAGGQGAPLVPGIEPILFSGFDGWLNLGGIANVTILENGQTIGWDVCPFNQVLNYLAQKQGMSYDDKGTTAAQGTIIEEWMSRLETWPFLKISRPKSISNEMVRDEIISHIPEADPKDLMHTFCHFAAKTIAGEFVGTQKVLVTGGGSYHAFFINLLKDRVRGKTQFVIPDHHIVSFKEAIIFGFMGVLYQLQIPNTFGRITGASKDSITGAMYFP